MAVTALKPNKKLPPGMKGGPKNRVSTETLLAAGKHTRTKKGPLTATRTMNKLRCLVKKTLLATVKTPSFVH